ncbi:MAG: biotin/lipoyl-containing protein [Candidatus Kapaibacterium sp.]
MKKLKITVNGKSYEVEVEVLEDDEELNGGRFVPPHVDRTGNRDMGISPRPGFKSPAKAPKSKAPVATGDEKNLTSPINGVVLEIPVKEGQEVKENDILFVLEAMKMKTNISSPVNGRIESIKVKVNDHIESGQELLTFE